MRPTTADDSRARSQEPSMHELAAVDVDGLAGHEIARRRRQEHHRADQVVGHLRALDRAALDARGEIVAR